MATVIRRNSYPESLFMHISLNGREIEGTMNEGIFKPSNYNPLSDEEAKEIASDLNCNVVYSQSQMYNRVELNQPGERALSSPAAMVKLAGN